MKNASRSLLCLSCLFCLSSCEGSFSLWGGYGLAYSKEGHYSLKDESKKVKSHVFDRSVLAYVTKEKKYSSHGWEFNYEGHYYDYECRCGYRMSYDNLTFEKKEEGMSLVSYKRSKTGYDLSSHNEAPSGVAYKTIDLPYHFPSTYDGEKVTCIETEAFSSAGACKYQGDEESAFPNVASIKEHAFYKSFPLFPSPARQASGRGLSKRAG